ncbi:MAG: hypothetical protein AAFU41_19690 [Pseudomonadota bacterium]
MPNKSMSRDEMQTEALVVETLLSAAMALLGSGDTDATFTMIETAQEKARKLQSALDSVNAPQVAA